MGRRRKLAALDKLDGNPSRRLIEEPFIPEHLCDDARGCIEVIRASMPRQIYSTLNTFLLSAFAAAWAIHKRATHEISDPTFVAVAKTEAARLRAPGFASRANKR
jgi:hypothetical protein